MKIACLDFEGVLVPEIWISLSERTGIEGLQLTTRDIPDYHELMQHRLNIMNEHQLTYTDIYQAASILSPLDGAADFLRWLRGEFQVAIISDTFHELAKPLIEKLGYPVILCHTLEIDDADRIAGYTLRQEDPKRAAIRAFKSLHYEVLATGDSYNDIPMLEEADHSCFFMPSAKVVADYPAIPKAESYDELRDFFMAAL
ncbi:MAG: bifunctional phosphoserine phosphatase/homoserine phosphotransferase ThrH [Pseudomonadota bacterium]